MKKSHQFTQESNIVLSVGHDVLKKKKAQIFYFLRQMSFSFLLSIESRSFQDCCQKSPTSKTNYFQYTASCRYILLFREKKKRPTCKPMCVFSANTYQAVYYSGVSNFEFAAKTKKTSLLHMAFLIDFIEFRWRKLEIN